MRILLLNYEYPPLGGGAGIISEQLTKEFINLGHTVTVITTWFNGEQEYYQNKDLTIIRLKSKRKKTYQSNPIEMASWMFKAVKYIKQHPEIKNHDICLTNFTLPGGLVAYRIKKMYDIPYVILSHGHDIPFYYKRKMLFWHILLYWFIKQVSEQSEKIIIGSDYLKQKYVDPFIQDKNKCIVIPNGLHIKKEHIQKSYNDKMQIIFIGRLVHQKDPFTFLNAIRALKNYSSIPLEINILGDGNLRTVMEEFVINNQLENIHFRGKISHLKVYEYLENAHLLISTSLNEGMSVAILEAISHEVYVIATPASGNKDIIINDINGNLVNFQDYKQIVEYIKVFYNNNFLNKKTIAKSYLEEMHRRYSWHSIALSYIKLFNNILN